MAIETKTRARAVDGVAREVHRAFLDRAGNPKLRKAYANHLAAFAKSLGAGSPVEGVAELLRGPASRAAGLAEAFKADQLARGMTVGTTNTRFYVVRGVARLARELGAIDWTIDAPGVSLALPPPPARGRGEG